jgi:hypothetical protein
MVFLGFLEVSKQDILQTFWLVSLFLYKDKSMVHIRIIRMLKGHFRLSVGASRILLIRMGYTI